LPVVDLQGCRKCLFCREQKPTILADVIGDIAFYFFVALTLSHPRLVLL